MNRRDLLTTSSTGFFLGVSGCLTGLETGERNGNDKTDDECNEKTPTDDGCGENLVRLPKMYDEIGYGSLGEFELIAEPNRVSLGENISFTLRWVTDDGAEPPVTGNSVQFTVEYNTGCGWQSIYHKHEQMSWTSVGISKGEEASPPLTWFDWSFTLTQQGMEQSSEYNPSYTVCNPLQPGSYRFVYWGVSPPQEEESNWETEYAIGTKFHVEE